jgi:hypothetical protein
MMPATFSFNTGLLAESRCRVTDFANTKSITLYVTDIGEALAAKATCYYGIDALNQTLGV